MRKGLRGHTQATRRFPIDCQSVMRTASSSASFIPSLAKALPYRRAVTSETTALGEFLCRRKISAAVLSSTRTNMAATTPAPAYESLTGLLRELSSLGGVSSILGFDEQTVMPEGSSGVRGKQKAALAGVIYEKSASPSLDAAISACEDPTVLDTLSEYERAVVRDARRDYSHTSRVSKEFSAKIAAAETASVAAWAKARKENNWAAFSPHLTTMLDLAKEYATTTRPNMSPYDAAIDQYERGMTTARLRAVFEDVEKPLNDLLERVAAATKSAPPVKESLKGSEKWDVTAQAALCKSIAERMSFDFNTGLLAVSTHPFTGGCHGDTRITSRYSTTNPWEGIMGTTHEVGHGLYQEGLNKEHEGLPVAEPLSMGAHESQVRKEVRCDRVSLAVFLSYFPCLTR
jgi:carboxypeptidase Taq